MRAHSADDGGKEQRNRARAFSFAQFQYRNIKSTKMAALKCLMSSSLLESCPDSHFHHLSDRSGDHLIFGTSSSGEWGWFATTSCLEVRDLVTGNRLAFYNFRSEKKKFFSGNILKIVELSNFGLEGHALLVCLQTGSNSTLAVFSVSSNTCTKVAWVPFVATALATISSDLFSASSKWSAIQHCQAVVGTNNGRVVCVDMSAAQEKPSQLPEDAMLEICKFLKLSLYTAHAYTHTHTHTLSLSLSLTHSRSLFIDTISHSNAVCPKAPTRAFGSKPVSSLVWMVGTGHVLGVGYATGHFRLWSDSNAIEYAP